MNIFLEKIRQVKNCFLNKDEKKFINLLKKNLKINKKNKKALLIMNPSHFYFMHQFFLINSKIFSKYEFEGIWINPVVNRSNSFLGYLSYISRYFFSFLLYLKWKNLYYAIGVSNTKNISLIKVEKKIHKTLENNSRKFLEFKIKKKFRYNQIICGDLIYDSYLRFFNKVKIDKKNDIVFPISQIFLYLKRFDIFFKNNFFKYDLLLPIQASFVGNGYPVRYFLKKNKKVLGGWNFSQYIKKYSKNDYLHHYKWENYKSLFMKMKGKKDKIILAKDYLKKRFKGGVDQTNYYMKKGSYDNSNYKKNDKNLEKKIECIIFLPCFVDSPFAFGDIVFNDAYDWVIKTLDFLKSKKIKTVVKEHPNSKIPSRNFVKKLKNKYANNFEWVDRDTPNNLLFSRKPKFCISLRGNVLIEVAYHNIIPICGGRNPFCSYDFVITPKNDNDYFRKISLTIDNKLNFKMKKYRKNILECFYMHYLNNNDYNYIDNYSRKFNINRFMKDYLSNSKIFQKLKPEILKIINLS